MHLIIDLPLSSTSDPNGYSWYGSSNPLSTKINVCSTFKKKNLLKNVNILESMY